mmetsp:Transcript_97490/g.314792  ORF Transcript_97490/g.314792 Transcript_97490/m.314792 type:complete len:141 (-) Transcript_97490:744-1166(-)
MNLHAKLQERYAKDWRKRNTKCDLKSGHNGLPARRKTSTCTPIQGKLRVNTPIDMRPELVPIAWDATAMGNIKTAEPFTATRMKNPVSDEMRSTVIVDLTRRSSFRTADAQSGRPSRGEADSTCSADQAQDSISCAQPRP